jgi:hypothetical protein
MLWLADVNLLQVRQLGPREPESNRSRSPWFSFDQSALVERFDHLMHDWWRDPKIPLKV